MPQSIRQSRLPRSSPKIERPIKTRRVRLRFPDKIDGGRQNKRAPVNNSPNQTLSASPLLGRSLSLTTGCGLPVTITGVPLQTAHTLMQLEHQQHAIVCASSALSSNFLFIHILCDVATCKVRSPLFRAVAQTLLKPQIPGIQWVYHVQAAPRSMKRWGLCCGNRYTSTFVGRGFRFIGYYRSDY